MIAVLSALSLSGALPALAQSDGGADHVVLAFNESDGLLRSASGVAVAHVASDTVDSENLAYAKSRCSDCRTVAAAMQVVLTRDAHTIVPKNAAVAVNETCSSCRTFAAAYQYVITTGGPVYLSADGQQRVADLRQRAAAVAGSDLAFADIEARLDGIYAELRAVIDDELRRAGRPFTATSAKRLDAAG